MRSRLPTRTLSRVSNLESAVERRLRQRVRAMGGRTDKFLPCSAGAPDRLVLLPGGRVVLVELKATTGRLRPIQNVWHESARALGTEVVVLTGAAEVDAWADEMKGKLKC